ncbi:MAG: hypothetical protein Q9N34_07280 [Aquificota bacterium]|nr:hypothetical protein [Aquificota bacterium]
MGTKREKIKDYGSNRSTETVYTQSIPQEQGSAKGKSKSGSSIPPGHSSEEGRKVHKSPWTERLKEAIRQWYHRLSKLMEYVLKSSQELYVDETKIKGRRRLYHLWLAVDKEGKPCFAYLSRRRDT